MCEIKGRPRPQATFTGADPAQRRHPLSPPDPCPGDRPKVCSRVDRGEARARSQDGTAEQVVLQGVQERSRGRRGRGEVGKGGPGSTQGAAWRRAGRHGNAPSVPEPLHPSAPGKGPSDSGCLVASHPPDRAAPTRQAGPGTATGHFTGGHLSARCRQTHMGLSLTVALGD